MGRSLFGQCGAGTLADEVEMVAATFQISDQIHKHVGILWFAFPFGKTVHMLLDHQSSLIIDFVFDFLGLKKKIQSRFFDDLLGIVELLGQKFLHLGKLPEDNVREDKTVVHLMHSISCDIVGNLGKTDDIGNIQLHLAEAGVDVLADTQGLDLDDIFRKLP